MQKVELPFYEYRIDLYGFSCEENSTVAIELKLSDWRRAVEQAMLYQLCADLVYIAMPERATKRVDLTESEFAWGWSHRRSGIRNLFLCAGG